MRTAAAIVVTTGLALLAAACGGSSGSHVQPGSTSTSADALRYARCMRSHGVTGFPDPDSSGEIPKPQVVDAARSNPSRFDSASRACSPLNPNGGRPQQTITSADRSDYLEAAACMRRHGFPGFPDPTFQNNNVVLHIPSSIDSHSPRFKRAAATCTRLIPAGLPYNGSSGS